MLGSTKMARAKLAMRQAYSRSALTQSGHKLGGGSKAVVGSRACTFDLQIRLEFVQPDRVNGRFGTLSPWTVSGGTCTELASRDQRRECARMWRKGRRLTLREANSALQGVRGLTGQVVLQVLDGALAGDNGLHEEAEHGEHGQAPILDLLHLRSHSPEASELHHARPAAPVLKSAMNIIRPCGSACEAAGVILRQQKQSESQGTACAS